LQIIRTFNILTKIIGTWQQNAPLNYFKNLFKSGLK